MIGEIRLDAIIPVELSDDLVDELEKGNCALVVGERISGGAAETPTSIELAKELAELCGFEGSGISLPAVSQYYEGTRSRKSLIDYIRKRVESVSHETSKAHRLIAELPFQIIISTGFDTLLEKAFAEAGKQYDRVLTAVDISFAFEPGRNALVKVFGAVDRPESLIITEDDRQKLFAGGKMTEILRFIAATKTLIYIACDLYDPTIWRIHFEATNNLGKYRRPAFAVQKGASSKFSAFWKQRGIEIVGADVVPFLWSLSVRLKAIEKVAEARSSPPLAVRKRPYKFLDYYETGDSDIFFGRTLDAAQIAQKALSHRLMVVFGKSGVGKTSILKAGMMPQLDKHGFSPIYVRTTDDAVKSIKRCVHERLQLTGLGSHWDSKASLRVCLQNAEDRIKQTLVIILDQAEELSTLLGRAARKSFEEALTECLVIDPPVARFIIALREDFLGEFHELKLGVPDVLRNRYRLRPLTREQAKEAITRPLVGSTMEFESKLVEMVLDDLSEDQAQFVGVEPPQLQIVCDRLYDACAGSQTLISVSLYQQLGGAKRLLGDYVDSVLEAMGEGEKEQARRVLKSLVTSYPTKRLMAIDEIIQMTDTSLSILEPTLNLLVAHRLIRRVAVSGTYYFELSHEHLVSKIREWIDEPEMRAKATQDLLKQEMNNWYVFEWLMEIERFLQINQERDNPYLRLGERELRLILRCVMRYGIDIDYWVRRASNLGISVWEYIEEGINNKNAETRAHTVDLLRFLGTDRAVEYLAIAIKDEYPSVHARAVASLHEVGTSRAHEVLRTNLPKDMILIPAGVFTMGPGNAIDQAGDTLDHGEPCRVGLDAFYIDKYPVTNMEYKRFVDATGHTPPSYWDGKKYPAEKARHPVIQVSWYDAKDYAQWAGKRLPTEAEWEKAARGPNEYLFPWGNKFNPSLCNTSESRVQDTVPVDAHSPEGDSFYGVGDVAGNAWDWTSSHFRPYPYDAKDGREQISDTGTGGRVRRGGSWFYGRDMCSSTIRYVSREPVYRSSATGFRCALSIPAETEKDTG